MHDTVAGDRINQRCSLPLKKQIAGRSIFPWQKKTAGRAAKK
jgi:hypothetical protein